MSNDENSLDLENEAYVGPSDEYKNYADVTQQPFRSEDPTVSAFEQRGIDWQRDMVVKRTDVASARAVGIITDVEGNVIDTSTPVGVDFKPRESDGDPVLSSNQKAPSAGEPDFAKFVADRQAARTGATSQASAGAGTSDLVSPNASTETSEPEDIDEGSTVAELQDELHRRGLPVSGNKAELIERLRDDDEK